MIGLVLVSHSDALAQATADLALQMVHDVRPEIRLAAGAAGGFGTDAAAIAAAIDELAELTSGVVLLTDLGSAVLSASLALDIRSSTVPVRVSTGP
ncbi:MAG: HPr family phosphocarrier protein, partial [Microbacterium sp.]